MTNIARATGVIVGLVTLAVGAWIAIPPVWAGMVHFYAALPDAFLRLF